MFNIFRLYAHYGDSLTIYINFKSNRLFPYSSTGIGKFEVVHFEESLLWYDHYRQNLPHYIMTGILLILFLYYLIIFLINKEVTHLHLTFFFLGLFLNTFNTSNIYAQFQSNRAITVFATSISLLGLFNYTETVLKIKQISLWVHKLNSFVFILLLIVLLTQFGVLSYQYLFEPAIVSDEEPVIGKISNYFTLFVVIILLIQAIFVAIKRVKYANLFLLFYILSIGSQLIPSYPGVWKFGYDHVTSFSYVLLTLSTLGLMLVTAYRLKQLREDQAEKEKAQARKEPNINFWPT